MRWGCRCFPCLFFEMRFLGDAAKQLKLHRRPVPFVSDGCALCGSRFGCWGGIPEQPLCARGSLVQPAWRLGSHRGRPGHKLGLPSVPGLPSSVTCPGCVAEAVPAVCEQGLAIPVSVFVSLPAVRRRVPEAAGEELPVSLWAALHGDAHQGESLALAGGCF